MKSFIRWIDHDQESRNRITELMRFGRQKESRDELGIGTLRDSFSDQLFPGTSVLQTRLRYMLFIPWIYTRFEDRQLSPDKVEEEVKKFELALIERIRGSEDNDGLIGKRAGQDLKVLPSSIYWTGLGAWGIRSNQYATHTQSDYLKSLSSAYRKMKSMKTLRDEAYKIGEGEDAPVEQYRTWSSLPDPPESFYDPEKLVDFRLSEEEAQVVLDYLNVNQGDTALFELAKSSDVTLDILSAEYLWDPIIQSVFSSRTKEIIEHARLFSYCVKGGALLYNYLLARHKEKVFPEMAEKMVELAKQYASLLDEWSQLEENQNLDKWDFQKFKEISRRSTHRVENALEFIEEWLEILLTEKKPLYESISAIELIRKREIKQKTSLSRFSRGNKRALREWNGGSGTNRLSFRWSNVQTMINDIHTALNQENS